MFNVVPAVKQHHATAEFHAAFPRQVSAHGQELRALDGSCRSAPAHALRQ
jgi:hypothetical protein